MKTIATASEIWSDVKNYFVWMANVSYLCPGVISMNINDFVWIFVNKVQGISLQTICILLVFKRSRCNETQFSFLVFFWKLYLLFGIRSKTWIDREIAWKRFDKAIAMSSDSPMQTFDTKYRKITVKYILIMAISFALEDFAL